MLLEEVFSNIATLDSASIDLDTNGDGVIVAGNYTKVIGAINLALTSLYTEFPVKEKLLVVQLFAHITDYLLTDDYASTNIGSTQPYKYIMDTSFDPFMNDLLQIISVSNEGGTELVLNTQNQLYSLYTPEYNVLQHPYPDDDNAIFITYRAAHVKIPVSADPATYDVIIPTQLLPLLLVYVNHKLLASINKEESMAKLKEYFELVNRSRTLGLYNTVGSSNEKLEANGFV